MNWRKLRRLLRRSGWILVRTRNHEVWRCPCGEHQECLPISSSDHRAIKNKIAQLRNLGCPNLNL